MRRIIKKLNELFRDRAEIKRQFRWLCRAAKPCVPQLLVLFVVHSILAGVSVGLSLVNKTIIDQAIQASGGFDTAAFVLLVALTVGNMVISISGTVLTTMINERFTFRMRADLFDRLLHSQWAALKRFHSGDVQTRLTSDLNTVTEGICSLIPNMLGLLLRLGLAFGVLYHYDHMLALAALLLGPFGVLCSLIFTPVMHHYQTQVRENDSRIRSFMQESTENLTIVKSFCVEDASIKRYESLRNERMRLVLRQSSFSGLTRLVMNMVFSAGHMLAFGWGILRVANAEITYGTMSVFLSLISQIQGPIMGMGNVVTQLVSVLASAGRVMELERMPAEEQGSAPVFTGPVGMRMHGVSFSYDDAADEQEVLQDVSLEVKPGESAAVIGQTGSGKTTMALLLLHLVEARAGEIIFYDADGHDAGASAGMRKLIAYVPQGNTLMSGTVRDNLLAPDAGDDELWQALETAEAAEFVREIGLDAKIGERGVGLSEGQAQRLAIARALLRKAPILILDEASASLDMQTEKKIMENLRRRTRDVTCIVITHRPSLLGICDRCFRVEHGRVTEVPKDENWI